MINIYAMDQLQIQHVSDNKIFDERSIYGLYIKSAPFFVDLKKIPETENNSRFIS